MNQALGSITIIRKPDLSSPGWSAERDGLTVNGLGAAELLQGTLTAFFASRQCPGTAIRAATAWALQQARERSTVISGFHSPLEQSVLRLLVEARSPVIVVLGRPVAGTLLRSGWREALVAGRLAVVSDSTGTQRLTEHSAQVRNKLAARLADHIFIAHASPDGQLALQCTHWLAECRDVRWIADAQGHL